jgi:hypothetical protein
MSTAISFEVLPQSRARKVPDVYVIVISRKIGRLPAGDGKLCLSGKGEA